MASLRERVAEYQDELRDGIAWIAFWKEGRSWNAQSFWLEIEEEGEFLDAEARKDIEKIRCTDSAAVVLNGYYCGYLGDDMALDELTAGVRYYYEQGFNNIENFIIQTSKEDDKNWSKEIGGIYNGNKTQRERRNR